MLSSFGGSEKQEVLLADGGAPDLVLDKIVVDFDPAVVQVGLHSANGVAGVLKGLAKSALGKASATGDEQNNGFLQTPQDGAGENRPGSLAQDWTRFANPQRVLKLVEVGRLPDDPSGPDRGFG